MGPCRRILCVALILAAAFASRPALAAPLHQEAPDSPDAQLGSGFTFQGRLDKAGAPVTATCAMSFDLWDSSLGGAQIGATEAIGAVAVANGLFTVVLNAGGQFGAAAFNGQARFLEAAVQCPGDASPITLPRQQLTASPYALTALSANALRERPVSNVVPAAGQVLTWSGSAWAPAAPSWGALTGVPPGFSDGIDDEGWKLDGNAGTTPANRLGTTDFMTVTVIMSDTTALRFVGNPGTDLQEFQPNLVGGSFVNTIGPGVQGAVIGGGGRFYNSFAPNAIFDSYGVIGGGLDNEAGLNDGLAHLQFAPFVGGGYSNEAIGAFSVIGGGLQSQVSAAYGTVGGGQYNTVESTSRYGFIPGGSSATATQYGQFAHAGGQFNNPGDAQASVFLLRNTTNSTASQNLYLDCSETTNANLGSGTPCTSGMELAIPNGRALAFQLMVIARTVTGAGSLPTLSTAGYFTTGILRNQGGLTVLTPNGSVGEVGDAAAIAALSIQLAANDADDTLRITVQSTQGGHVRWVARLEAVEVAN